MRLAKDKNGNIGRQVRTIGENPIVEIPRSAGRRGNVYLSSKSIADDDSYYAKREAMKLAQIQAQAIRRQAIDKAKKLQEEKRRQLILNQQKNRQVNSVDEIKVANYLMGQADQSQSEQVARSLSADFSQTEQVADNKFCKVISRSDFNSNQILGNPLTRNGKFGPTTDFDYLVKGRELDNDKIVGGTMLGRYNGENTPYKNTMGFDLLEWGNNLLTNTFQQIEEQAPDKLAEEALRRISPQPQQTQTTTIIRQVAPTGNPVADGINQTAQKLGVPPWAVYSAIGLLGLGVALVTYKVVAGKNG